MADVRRIGLDEVVRQFQDLEDPRSTVNRRHPLASVLVIALLAVLAGAGGPTAIAGWATTKQVPLAGVSLAPTASPGGAMPLGFLTEAGPRPEFADLYETVGMPTASYPVRTRQNVKDSE